MRDLLNIEVVAVLNQAFCHLHHYKFCPHTDELITQCGMVSTAEHRPCGMRRSLAISLRVDNEGHRA